MITGIQTNTMRCYPVFSSSRRSRALDNLIRNTEVPHGIPTTRMIFKSWRESRERQCDFAQAKTTLMPSRHKWFWTLIGKTIRLPDYQTIFHKLTDFSVVGYATLRNTLKFLVPRAKESIFKFFFFLSTNNQWMELTFRRYNSCR